MKDAFQRPALTINVLVPAVLMLMVPIGAHESTRTTFLKRHNVAALARPVGTGILAGHEVCNLKVSLMEEGSGVELPGLIRVTAESRDEALELPGLFHRAGGWHTIPPSAEIAVPPHETVDRGAAWTGDGENGTVLGLVREEPGGDPAAPAPHL